jgi:replicative DNA helicase
LLQTFPKIRPYVAFVDSEFKDLDKLLTIENGIFRANQIISEAVPAWEYQLNRIVEKYAEIQDHNKDGVLTAKDIDAMLHDIVTTAAKYSSLDAEQFINSFTRDEAIQAMGITSESLTAIAKDIRENEGREARIKSTKELLTEVQGYLGKGLDTKALEVLQAKGKVIKETDKANQFDLLTRPVTEAEVIARVKQKLNDLQTGYKIDGEELLLPAGAITTIAAPTSHGKTTFLINLALRVAQKYDNKSIYFLSYEEDADSVLISAMNTFIAADLSTNNRKSIRSFFRNESDEYVKASAKGTFDAGKAKFFRELINSGRLSIQYVDYDSDTLSDAIHHLYKHGNAGAVFIDYIQFLRKEGKFGDRQKEMKEICGDLKNAAVDTGLPLIVGAQFNREVINAARLHPTKIGEAGDIERASNVIIGFWNNNFDPLAGDDEVEALSTYDHRKNAFFVKNLKNRGGRVGWSGMLDFDGNTGVISNERKFAKEF